MCERSCRHSPERNARYLATVRDKLKEAGTGALAKVAHLNWLLALTYHERETGTRAYDWPLRLTGVIQKENAPSGGWRFRHLHFSLPAAEYPDERFECGYDFASRHEAIKQRVTTADTPLGQDLKERLSALSCLFGTGTKAEGCMVPSLFSDKAPPLVISPRAACHAGIPAVEDFLGGMADVRLQLDLSHLHIDSNTDATWVIAHGLLTSGKEGETLAEESVQALSARLASRGANNQASPGSSESPDSLRNTLFTVHRKLAATLREAAHGSRQTYPIRLTALLVDEGRGPVFQQLHFSFPHYWILEGKM